jgi:hypothetical protein
MLITSSPLLLYYVFTIQSNSGYVLTVQQDAVFTGAPFARPGRNQQVRVVGTWLLRTQTHFLKRQANCSHDPTYMSEWQFAKMLKEVVVANSKYNSVSVWKYWGAQCRTSVRVQNIRGESSTQDLSTRGRMVRPGSHTYGSDCPPVAPNRVRRTQPAQAAAAQMAFLSRSPLLSAR